jgi:hypothetical protein
VRFTRIFRHTNERNKGYASVNLNSSSIRRVLYPEVAEPVALSRFAGVCGPDRRGTHETRSCNEQHWRTLERVKVVKTRGFLDVRSVLQLRSLW